MCYSFNKLTPPNALHFQALTRSTFLQFVMYEIILNEKFKNANRVSVMSFGGYGIPYESRDYAASFFLDSLSNPKANYLEVSSSDFIVEKLKAPFDTNCAPCSVYTCRWYICKTDCIAKALAKHRKVASTLITTKPTPFPVVGANDLKNETMMNMTKQIYRTCDHKCAHIPCHTTYSKTTAFPQRYANHSIAFASLTPTEPVIKTSAQPTMTGIDYFSFVCACFGTWFGLSCLSLTRVVHMMTKKKRDEQLRKTIVVNVFDTDNRIKRILRIQ